MKQIKVAIVGAGDWGKNLIRNFNKIANLVAICDLNTAIADDVASQYKIKNLSWLQILASKEIDAIGIANNRSHYELAKEALLANKHVFVEKPLAYTVLQAQELCSIAASVNKKIMVGHLLNYHPAFIKLKTMCINQDLGDLHYVYSNRLAFGKFMPEEDVILNFASHDISMLLSLIGKPKSIMAWADKFLMQDVIDQVILKFKFSENLHGHVFASWLHPVKERKLIVIGSQAMAVFDDLLAWPQKLCLYHGNIAWQGDYPSLKGLNHEFIHIEDPIEPLFNEIKHFLECVAFNLTPKTDGLEALEVLKVIEQAYQQLNIANNRGI